MTDADILAYTYFEKMTIKRCMSFKNEETGVTQIDEEGVIIAENVPCAVSQGSIPSLLDTEIANIVITHELYCRPNIDLKAGDMLDITFKNGDIKTFIASEYSYYDSHLQVPITLKERI
ncbi:Uncharacterised protein [Clostridioides difficile]|nr:Uncharacterised protein [Clostridioides difficile]